MREIMLNIFYHQENVYLNLYTWLNYRKIKTDTIKFSENLRLLELSSKMGKQNGTTTVDRNWCGRERQVTFLTVRRHPGLCPDACASSMNIPLSLENAQTLLRPLGCLLPSLSPCWPHEHHLYSWSYPLYKCSPGKLIYSPWGSDTSCFVQLLSHVWLLATLWTAAYQTSLSFTVS